jgi:hypothetical protein
LSHSILRIPEETSAAHQAPSQHSLTQAVAREPSGFSSADAMTTLLTVESLVFAVFSIALALISNLDLAVNAEKSARALTLVSSSLVTALGLGAIVAWGQSFLGEWPSGVATMFPLICIAAGVLMQPVLSWWIAWLNLRRADEGSI